MSKCWTTFNTFVYCKSYCCGSSLYSGYCCSDCALAYSNSCSLGVSSVGLNTWIYACISVGVFIIVTSIVAAWYFKYYRNRATRLVNPVVSTTLTVQSPQMIGTAPPPPSYSAQIGYTMAPPAYEMSSFAPVNTFQPTQMIMAMPMQTGQPTTYTTPYTYGWAPPPEAPQAKY